MLKPRFLFYIPLMLILKLRMMPMTELIISFYIPLMLILKRLWSRKDRFDFCAHSTNAYIKTNIPARFDKAMYTFTFH